MLTFIWRFWFRFSHLMIRFSMIFVCDQIEPINKRQTFEQVQVDVINFYNFFCCCCYWSPSNRWQLEMKFQIKQYWPLESSYTIERNEWQWIKIGYWRQVFFFVSIELMIIEPSCDEKWIKEKTILDNNPWTRFL